MASRLTLRERIIFRIIYQMLAFAAGYAAYEQFGFLVGIGVAVAVWLVVSVIFGMAAARKRVRKYENHRRDFQ